MQHKACSFFATLLLSITSIEALNFGKNVILAPQYFNNEQPYEISMASFDSKKSTDFKAILYGYSDDGQEVQHQMSRTMLPNSTDITRFPKVPPGDYKLKVEFLSDVQQIREIALTNRNQNYVVLIQTDKPIYKPGNTVRFRILVLDQATRPVDDLKSIQVSLYDPDENLVKEWRDARLRNGVFQSQLDIANAPNLGDWSIVANVRGVEHSVQFPVDVYRLPQHEIRIRAPKPVTAQDQELTVEIDAYYGFGRVVKGYINVTAVGLKTLSNTFSFNGRLRVKFNVADLLDVDNFDEDYQDIHIMVNIQEDHSRNKIFAEKWIPIFKNRYQVQLHKSSKFFIPGLPYKCWLHFKNPAGGKAVLLPDQVTVTVVYSGSEKFKKSQTLHLTANSDGSIPLSLSIPKEASAAELSISYENEQKSFHLSSERAKVAASLQLSKMTDKVLLNQPVSFQVQSTVLLNNLVYQISKGNQILLIDRFHVGGENSPVFSVKITDAMFPLIKIIVFTIHDGHLLSDELTVDVPILPNSIELSTVSDEYSPGDKVRFLVESKPNSFVGLLAIDRSVLLLGLSGNQISQHAVLEALKADGSEDSGENDVSTIQIISNAKTPTAVTTRFNEESYDEEDAYIKPRKAFPESWLWDELQQVGSDGKLRITDYVPDSITTWDVTAFSISPQQGLGVVERPLSLKVTKPGFMKINLPNSIKKSETAVVEVSVFNNRGEVEYVGVTLKNSQHEFELVDNKGRVDASYQAKNAVVGPYSATTVRFTIRPKKLGDIEVKVIAEGTVLKDSVVRLLRVTPESLAYQMDIRRYIELDNGKQEFHPFHLSIPRYIDAGSEEISFSVSADFIENSLSDLQDSIRLPHGNAEQTALHMIPSLVLLEHNGTTYSYNARVTDRARLFLEKGYQNELKFKRNDGSFSLFGKEDQSGSIYVTALVARTLLRASDFITIDKRVVDQAYKWLEKQQMSNGKFTELSKDQEYSHREAYGDDATLTAFTLLAFLEDDKKIAEYRNLIDRGCSYLFSKYLDNQNLYTLSMTAYALQLSNYTSNRIVVDKFIELSNFDYKNQFRWWDAGSLSIEATGYGLLLFLTIHQAIDSKYILNWIVTKQRSDFFNTQTPFTALEAMALYAHTFSTSRNNYDVTLAYGQNKNIIHIDAESSKTEQKIILPPSTRVIEVSINGTGYGMFSIDYAYRSNILNLRPRFDVKLEVLNSSSELYLDLSICSKFLPRESYEEAWLVLMEITFPSGYIALDESVEELESLSIVKKLQLKYSETTLLLYFDSLPSSYQCLKVTGFQQSVVLQQIPGTVRVYDFYDNSRVAIAYFDGSQPQLCEGC